MTPQLCPGDYGVTDARPSARGARFVSGAIRVLTRSPWSHAFVVVADDMVIEATPHGAELNPLSNYHTGQPVAFSDLEPKTPAQREAIIAAAHSLVGTPYNFLDILALALIGLGIRWGWPARRACRGDRLICSQLVTACYLAAGISLTTKPAQLVTPADLGLRLAERPWDRNK